MNRINNLTVCRRKHLLNGLISAATSDAVAAMVDEVVTGTVDPNLINQWVTSLAFIPRYISSLINNGQHELKLFFKL